MQQNLKEKNEKKMQKKLNKKVDLEESFLNLKNILQSNNSQSRFFIESPNKYESLPKKSFKPISWP